MHVAELNIGIPRIYRVADNDVLGSLCTNGGGSAYCEQEFVVRGLRRRPMEGHDLPIFLRNKVLKDDDNGVTAALLPT